MVQIIRILVVFFYMRNQHTADDVCNCLISMHIFASHEYCCIANDFMYNFEVKQTLDFQRTNIIELNFRLRIKDLQVNISEFKLGFFD